MRERERERERAREGCGGSGWKYLIFRLMWGVVTIRRDWFNPQMNIMTYNVLENNKCFTPIISKSSSVGR